MAHLLGISHVAFNVTDFDRAIEFYCSRLGFKRAFGLKVPDNIEEFMPGTPLAAIKGKESLVYLEAPDGSYIELFRPLPGNDLTGGGPNYDRAGYAHMSLQVDDLDGFVAGLTEAGVPIDSEKQFGPDNTYTVWIKDPDGNRIELMEYTENSLQLTKETK